MTDDKQLRDIRLEDVLKKRQLEQALNAKEFAVLAGISYSTARSWFHLPGFPAFRGVIFWQDFTQWRMAQNGVKQTPETLPQRSCETGTVVSNLPARAARILLEA